MKRLLIAIACFVSMGVHAQDKTLTVRKTVSGLIYGSDPSALRDTIPSFRLTGLANGMLPVYNSTTKKWHATAFSVGILPGLQDSLTKKANRTFDNVASGAIPIAKLAASTISGVNLGGNLANLSAGNGLSFTSYNGSTARTANADTAILQTVLNFFPKGDTRYQKLSNQLNGTGIVEMSGTSVSYLSSTGTGNVVKAVSPTLTTPNIGNATGGTLNLSGLITSTLGNNTVLFNSQSATTGYQYFNIQNTSGRLILGLEGSSGGTLLTGGAAYAAIFTTLGTKNLEFATDQVLGLRIDGTNRKITLPELGGAGDVIVGANNTGLLSEITVGSGLSLSGGVLTATGGSSGSVTTSGGTAGKISKFTSASNIENSIMTESSGLIDVAGDITGDVITTDIGLKYNFSGANRGGIYAYSYLSGSGTNYTPTYFSESGLGVNFYVDGGLTKGLSISSGGDATFSGSISSPDEIPFVLSSATTIDFHQSNSGTVRFVNNAFSAVNMSITNAGDVGIRGALTVTGAASASNLSGTNTGDQTTITGNAATATALQTARNIQGVSFNGTADINPISGTGFVKVSGTTLSYDNSTYLTTSSASSTYAPIASPTFTGTVSGITAAMVGAPSGSGTSSGTNTGDQNLTPYALLASPAFTGNPTAPTQAIGDNSTKIATTAYVDAYSPFPIFDSGTIILSGNGSTAIFDTGIAESTSITAPNLMIASAYEQAAKIAWSLGLVANGSGGNNWTINFATPPASGTNNVKFNYILVMP